MAISEVSGVVTLKLPNGQTVEALVQSSRNGFSLTVGDDHIEPFVDRTFLADRSMHRFFVENLDKELTFELLQKED